MSEQSNDAGVAVTDKMEFLRLVRSVQADRIPVDLDIGSAVCLVALLQLTMRHPQVTGPAAKVGRKMIDGLIDVLSRNCDDPARLRHLLEQGDDPQCDLRGFSSGAGS